mgnify:CR=1 FL=1
MDGVALTSFMLLTSAVLRLISSVCFAAAAASALRAASRACIACICASSSLVPFFTVNIGVFGLGRRRVGFLISSGSVTSNGDLFIVIEDPTLDAAEPGRTGIVVLSSSEVVRRPAS